VVGHRWKVDAIEQRVGPADGIHIELAGVTGGMYHPDARFPRGWE
jgi:hypothetical protein